METITQSHKMMQHAVQTKTCLGLPSLQGKRKAPSLLPRLPVLTRTFSLLSGVPGGVCGALPLPFLEINVSVLDTLDVMRSSIEEEVST